MVYAELTDSSGRRRGLVMRTSVLSGDPPSAASRQIFGVSFPSKRGPLGAGRARSPDMTRPDTPYVAGIARAATPAVFRIVLRDGLFMRLYYTRSRQRVKWKLTGYIWQRLHAVIRGSSPEGFRRRPFGRQQGVNVTKRTRSLGCRKLERSTVNFHGGHHYEPS